MNLRNVLRTYARLRQLSDDESALLATLRGMNESERESLVLAMQPEKAAGKKPATNRKGGCAACDYTKPSLIHYKATMTGYHVYQPAKSQRASNMAATLGKNLAQQRESAKDITGESFHPLLVPCAYVPEDGTVPCDLTADSAIHDKKAGYSGYHEFVTPSVQAAGVGD